LWHTRHLFLRVSDDKRDMYTRNNALQIIFACRKGRFTSTKISCKQVLKAGREGNWFERRHAGSGMQRLKRARRFTCGSTQNDLQQNGVG
jgi:hypothetical protein